MIVGVVAVATLSALVSEPGNVQTFVGKPIEALPTPSPTQVNPRCERPDREIYAGEIFEPFNRLTYRGYLIQTKHRTAKLHVPPEYGPPPKPVKVSYAVVKRRNRTIAKFDGDIYFPLGNSLTGGFFPLLNNGGKQLVISQDIVKTGAQWVADFSKGFKIIFDGPKFQVGRESDDMTIVDLDRDGISEIIVPLTAFYGFEDWRLTTSDTPLPSIIFKYDSVQREYLPANPHFKECLSRDIEADKKSLLSLNEEQSLGRLMSVVLDHVFTGEEERGWKFFDESCKLPDKARIKEDMLKEVKEHPVYRHIYKKRVNR
ncbi:MAG TPA: hypothetical protein VIU65_00775 [Pyrinomonadaceae bacterium]